MSSVERLLTATNSDHVLEQAAGAYQDVLLIGWSVEGDLDVRSNKSLTAREALWLVEQFKFKLLKGDYTSE